MELSFENVGKVAKAEIEVDLITVIAGSNDTGKSTAGKILYSIYTALRDLAPEKLLRNKVESIVSENQKLVNLLGELRVEEYGGGGFFGYGFSDYYESLSKNPAGNHESQEEFLNTCVKQWVQMQKERIKDEKFSNRNKKQIEDTFQEMLAMADIKSNSKKIRLFSIQDVLLSEFSGSLTTELYANLPAKIYLKEDSGNEMNFEFLANEIDHNLSHIERKREYEQPFYIDNPFVLDELNNPRRNISDDSYKHNDRMINAIENPPMQNPFDKMLENKDIRSVLDSVVEGRIFKRGWRYQYQTSKMLNPVDIENLSTGMKSFAILKMLFDSQQLDKIELLILDEPEIHLHPEWQLKYAELVVLLASKRPVQIVITTHSPYFIEAIELYSKKHKIDEHVRYYNADNREDGMSEILDVTNKLEVLYESMSEPFQNLEELRDELDEEQI